MNVCQVTAAGSARYCHRYAATQPWKPPVLQCEMATCVYFVVCSFRNGIQCVQRFVPERNTCPCPAGSFFFSQMLCDSWLVLDRGFGTSAAYMRNTTTHAGWRSSTCMCDCVSLVLLCSATSNPWFYSCQECIVSTSQEMCCHGGRKKKRPLGEHDVRPPALARQPPPSPLPPFHLCLPACWLLEFAFKRVQTPKKESGGPMLPTSQ